MPFHIEQMSGMMKRTEMVDKMKHTYMQCAIMRYSPDQIMDRVLEICEENGMSPPPDPNTEGPKGLGQLCQWEYDGENHE